VGKTYKTFCRKQKPKKETIEKVQKKSVVASSLRFSQRRSLILFQRFTLHFILECVPCIFSPQKLYHTHLYMTLKETITQQMTTAMKSGDKVRLETIRSVRAGILEYEKSGKGDIADENVLQIINNQVKKRKETIEMAQKANRPEMVAEEEAQLKILQEFLPKQMSAEEVRAEVKRIAEQVGAKEFSKVMPLVMKELKGRADGKMVQEIVKEVLA
jgi:uncharacterized protein YqeY